MPYCRKKTPVLIIEDNDNHFDQIKNKIDLIDELSDLAEETSANVVLISQNSEEGDSLSAAFNGIAGITRYPIDF